MTTYTTLDGRVLDLTALTGEERAHLDAAYDAYCAGMALATFDASYMSGGANPLLRTTGGWVTRAAWEHPLYQAVHDLGDRLGIAQGELAPEGDWERDPFADEWVSTAEAARQKSVALTAVHKAIRRGDLMARPANADTARLVVSANSLTRWTPNPRRQAAGRHAVARARPEPQPAGRRRA